MRRTSRKRHRSVDHITHGHRRSRLPEHRELGSTNEQTLYTAIIDDALMIESLSHADWVRIRELVGTYGNLPLGGTDASLIALAERFAAEQVATLDRRHFTVVRPSHVAAFTLVP